MQRKGDSASIGPLPYHYALIFIYRSQIDFIIWENCNSAKSNANQHMTAIGCRLGR